MDKEERKICGLLLLPLRTLSHSAYLAAVNAASERAPMIYPRAVSEGQFYSPPESLAGTTLHLPFSLPCNSQCLSQSSLSAISLFLFVSPLRCLLPNCNLHATCVCYDGQGLRRTWMRRGWVAGQSPPMRRSW